MRRNLFLYLALACFIALIAIFIVDGYMGLYDTIFITVSEREEIVEANYWLQQYPYEYPYPISAQWEQKVFFRYEIDNRRFSSYSTPVQASLWKENEKVLDLFSGEKSMEPFDKAMAEWTLSTQELEQPAPGASIHYTVKINHGEVERRIVVNVYYPMEPIPPEKLR